MNLTGERRAVSVIGLGKLGACTAACIASKGVPVTGVDVSAEVVNAVNRAEAPVHEPGLSTLMKKCAENFRATTDYRSAVMSSNITLVIVPTPSEPSGKFSTAYVIGAAEQIGKALAEKDRYHVVVLTSTVLPGATERDFIPAIERASGKTAGRDFGVCYNPEFIALGSVIHDFLNPDFVLIGESDTRAGDSLEGLYRAVCENHPPLQRMRIVNAEITKLAVNTFVTTKIAYANMLGEICEKLPGADVDVVTEAVGLDSRIGRKYLKAGLGYGGPCFPRDNLALGHLARSLGASADIPEATDRANRRQVERVVKAVQAHTPAGRRVAVLGLAYKPGSNVAEESQGLEIALSLGRLGFDVVAYDPIAMDNARTVAVGHIAFAASLSESVRGASTVVIANPDLAFGDLSADGLAAISRPVTIVDPWRWAPQALRHSNTVKYVPMGSGASGSRIRVPTASASADGRP